MLEVGGIVARAGVKLDDDGFDRFDKRMDSARREARRPIEAELRADLNDRGFEAFDRDVEKARRDTRRPIEAELKADHDGRGFDRFNDDVDRADRNTRDLDRSTGRLRGSIGAMAKGVGIAGAALAGGLALGAKKAWDEFEEAAKVGAQTDAVIKSTGRSANVTAEEVERLAGTLSAKAGMDDEAIQSGQNLLLTFKNIKNEAGAGNDIFNQTTSVMVDFAAAMGKEPRDAAIMLGKSLNDPIKGLTALGRAGVQFTEDQKEQIKTLVESGDTMGAQKIILKELNDQFAGSAEAQARPLDKAKVAVLNLFEAIGEKLAPSVEAAANWLAEFTQGMIDGEGAAGGVARVIGKVGDVLSDVGRFVADFVDAIAGGERGSKRFGDSAAGVFTEVRRTAVAVFNTVKGVINDVVDAFRGSGDSLGIIGRAWGKWLGFILGIVQRLLPAFRSVFGGIAQIVRGVVDVVAGILSGDFGRIWDGLKRIVGGAVKAIGGIIQGLPGLVWSALKAVGSRVGRFAADFVSDGARAGRNFVSRLIRFVRDLPGDIWRVLRSAGSRVGRWVADFVSDGASAGRRFVDRLIRFVRELPGDIASVLRRAGGRVTSWVRDFVSDGASAGRRFVTGLINRVRDLPGDVAGWLRRTVSRVASFVGDMASKGADVGRAAVRGAVNAVEDLPGRVMGFFNRMVDRIRGIPGRILGIFRGIGGRIANAVRDGANKLIPDSIGFGPKKVGGKTVIPRVEIRIPQLAKGAKVGPTSGGPELFIAGEGGKDEWVISQEGDRRKNIGWALEALEELTGRKVATYMSGKGISRARSSSRAITSQETKIQRLQRALGQTSTRFELSDEELVTEGADGIARVNPQMVAKRAGELDILKGLATQIRNEVGALWQAVRQSVHAWTSVRDNAVVASQTVRVRGSKAAKKRARGRIKKYKGWASEAREALGELEPRLYEVGGTARPPANGIFPGGDWVDADLEAAGYSAEAAAVRGTRAPAASTPAPSTPGTPSTPDPTEPATPTAPSPEEVAAAAIAQVATFNAARSELFAGGSNFRVTGAGLFAGETSRAAGMRSFGGGDVGAEGLYAASGLANGRGGETNITFAPQFGGPPPDPHPWTRDALNRMAAELGA